MLEQHFQAATWFVAVVTMKIWAINSSMATKLPVYYLINAVEQIISLVSTRCSLALQIKTRPVNIRTIIFFPCGSMENNRELLTIFIVAAAFSSDHPVFYDQFYDQIYDHVTAYLLPD